ncbi:hypothetical protein E2562_020450 [Oryza meyeriana var. granulata]|uniref:Uncharacterized protein n=1 Tax=Oryza meyeriana var. granulata TaxID=110450 RepID=A0A6G1D4J9_9ORYZ|nr:hypothetical protein E2562_020450 [Oryza meyeriana var. granulata]
MGCPRSPPPVTRRLDLSRAILEVVTALARRPQHRENLAGSSLPSAALLPYGAILPRLLL